MTFCKTNLTQTKNWALIQIIHSNIEPKLMSSWLYNKKTSVLFKKLFAVGEFKKPWTL